MDTLDGWMIKKVPKRKRRAFWPYVFSLSVTSGSLIYLSSYRDVPIWFWVYGLIVMAWSAIKLIQGMKRRT